MFASQTNIKTAKDWQVATEIHNGARVLMKRDNYQLHSSEANGIYQNFGIRLNTSSSCIPSVTTVPHGGQIIVYSVSQHCTIWRSDHRVFHLSTLHHMAVRSLCSVTTRDTRAHAHTHARTHALQSIQYHIVIVYSVCQHMAVKSLCIPSVNTVPYGGQIIAYSICQHRTIWRSDHCVLFQSIQYHMALRSCIPPVNNVPHGGQTVHSASPF